MHNKPLIIVGIDPGVTMGYAVLDINGNLIKLRSSKLLSLNSLIQEVHSLGKVLLVGVDKMNSPSLVYAFAVKVGAKLISPNKDMKIMEKNLLTQGYEFVNDHERDALASALFALKQHKPLLEKIDTYLKETKKEELSDKVKALVILKGLSIKEALHLLEEPKIEEEVKKIIEQKRFTEEDFIRLYEQVKILKQDLFHLKNQNENLKEEIERVKKEKLCLIEITSKKNEGKYKEKQDIKDKTIYKYINLLQEKDKEINFFKKKIDNLSNILSDLNNNCLLKKVANLGFKEYELKNKILKIQKDDILLVGDISIVSNETINALKDKISVIVYKNKPKKSALPFVLVNANELDIKEEENFAIVNKEEFEKKRKSIDLLWRIADHYRHEKSL